jgi:hypothetical protein
VTFIGVPTLRDGNGAADRPKKQTSASMQGSTIGVEQASVWWDDTCSRRSPVDTDSRDEMRDARGCLRMQMPVGPASWEARRMRRMERDGGECADRREAWDGNI